MGSRVPLGTPLPILDIKDIEDCVASEDHSPQKQPEVSNTEGSNEERKNHPKAASAGAEVTLNLKYIVCTYARAGNFLGRTHTIDPHWPAKTLCGWRYSDDHIITDNAFGSDDVNFTVPRCGSCVHNEEIRLL